jgi:hypothetical protein
MPLAAKVMGTKSVWASLWVSKSASPYHIEMMCILALIGGHSLRQTTAPPAVLAAAIDCLPVADPAGRPLWESAITLKAHHVT